MAADDDTACGICMEATDNIVLMPCCGRTEATTQYCAKCIGAMCARKPGGVGHCPSCRAPVAVEDGAVKLAVLPVGAAPTMTTRGVVLVRNRLLCEW